MGMRIIWDDPNWGEEGHYLYKSTTPIDPNALPAPYATVGVDVTEYFDGAVTPGTTYYYLVGAFTASGTVIKLSPQIELVASETTPDVSESFVTEVPADFGFIHIRPDPVSGAELLVSYNGTNQSMVLEGQKNENYFYIMYPSFPKINECTIEAEVNFVTDYTPEPRRHAGLAISDGDDSASYSGCYRIAYLDTEWGVTFMAPDGTATNITVTRTGTNVVFEQGVTAQLRVTFADGLYTLYVNGTEILSFEGLLFDTVRPGIQLYAAKLEVNYVYMWGVVK